MKRGPDQIFDCLLFFVCFLFLFFFILFKSPFILFFRGGGGGDKPSLQSYSFNYTFLKLNISKKNKTDLYILVRHCYMHHPVYYWAVLIWHTQNSFHVYTILITISNRTVLPGRINLLVFYSFQQRRIQDYSWGGGGRGNFLTAGVQGPP